MKNGIRHPLWVVCFLSLFILAPFMLSGVQAADPEPPLALDTDVPEIIIWAEVVDGEAPDVLLPEEGSGAEAHSLSPQAQTAFINVIYNGQWPSAAINAFEYAKRIWEARIVSNVPILVEATWEDMGDARVLGGAAAGGYRRWTTTPPNGAKANVWYPVALANTLAGSDLNGSEPEIIARFNSAFSHDGESGWDFDTDGNVDNSHWDFVSVVLHELGHGLGFAGSMSVNSSGLGSYGSNSGYPFIYDTFAQNLSNQPLVDNPLYPNPSFELGRQLVSGQLYFSGPRTLSANSNAFPKLYAPSGWQPGSSFSHFDEDAYPEGSLLSLMTPYLLNGEAVHDPGPVVLSLLADLGWPVNNAPANQTPTPRPTMLPTPKATAIPPAPKGKVQLYLPSISQSRGAALRTRIQGQVYQAGKPAANAGLELCLLQGTRCEPAANTTTGLNGEYAFELATPVVGGQYYVRYWNLGSTPEPGRVFYWAAPLVLRAAATQTVPAFDIADITLTGPQDGASASLPVEFTWSERVATSQDQYQLNLYGRTTTVNQITPRYWTDLLESGSYTLSGLPAPQVGTEFQYSVPYTWEVWACQAGAGCGVSYDTREISFSRTSTSSGDAAGAEQGIPASLDWLETEKQIFLEGLQALGAPR